MGKEVSLMFTARDGFSDNVNKMRSVQTAFRKDTQALQTELNTLNKTKVELKIDLHTAKKELSDAKKAFDGVGDAASKMQLTTAQAKFDGIKSNLDMVSKAAKQTERDITDLDKTISRQDNRAGGGGMGSASSLMSKAIQAGALKMAGDTITEAAMVAAGSAFGSNGATMLGGALGGATSGAAIGTMIAPGVGTAVGAVAGGALGLVNGGLQVYQKEDDAFKSYVQDQYTGIKTEEDRMRASGSEVAGQRETDQIAFATLFGGEDIASSFLGDVRKFAADTPFGYDQLTGMAKIMKSYNYDVDELLPQMQKLGDAGAALGMGQADMSMMATAIGRMRSSGKTSLEYTNILQDRGIDAIGYLAEAKGVDKGKVYEMISKNLIDGAEAAQIISDAMGRDYSGAMEKIAETFPGLTGALEDAKLELDAAMGAGYNDTRKQGIQEEIDYLSGESGAAMQEAYRQMGEWQASLENDAEEIQRKMMDAVMTGTDVSEYGTDVKDRLAELSAQYAEAAASGEEGAGAKMGQVLAEAQVMAKNEYMASDGYRLQLESDLTLIDSIRDDTSLQEAYWNAGHLMGEKFTEGLMASMRSGVSEAVAATAIQHTAVQSPKNILTDSSWSRSGGSTVSSDRITPHAGRKAFGMSYVPYDGMPALLDEGERVLTADENRRYPGGGAGSVVVTGNTFHVREEADVDKVAAALARKISQANQVYVGG